MVRAALRVHRATGGRSGAKGRGGAAPATAYARAAHAAAARATVVAGGQADAARASVIVPGAATGVRDFPRIGAAAAACEGTQCGQGNKKNQRQFVHGSDLVLVPDPGMRRSGVHVFSAEDQYVWVATAVDEVGRRVVEEVVAIQRSRNCTAAGCAIKATNGAVCVDLCVRLLARAGRRAVVQTSASEDVCPYDYPAELLPVLAHPVCGGRPSSIREAAGSDVDRLVIDSALALPGLQ